MDLRSVVVGIVSASLGTAVTVGLLAGMPSCVDEKARFAVNHAPGFDTNGAKVSVLGVFRDGRMNPETWDDMAPRFRGALRGETCDIAVSNALRTLNPPVFGAVDDVARSSGINDALIEQFAAAATGDTILVFVIAGKPPLSDAGITAGNLSDPQSINGPGGRSPPGHRGGPGGGATTMPGIYNTGRGAFEVTAVLYSKPQHASVGTIQMSYGGASEAEAYGKFADRLAVTFPNATCAGWNADLALDPAKIEQLKE
ncbi:MAG: hypothetical protein JWP97_4683 [Labilithrix sp.]|nr:hypothetical protein [Labilithrix sp.]